MVVSWKFTPGYDSPGITFRGATVQEVASQIESAATAGLYAAIAQAHDDSVAQWNLNKKLQAVPLNNPAAPTQKPGNQTSNSGNSSGGGYGNRNNQRSSYQNQGNNQAPPGDAPSCEHGERTWKTGTNASGKSWKGWMCPAPRGSGQCKPEFVND